MFMLNNTCEAACLMDFIQFLFEMHALCAIIHCVNANHIIVDASATICQRMPLR